MFKPIREIRDEDGNVHFRRWRIVETPLFNLYIHQILRNDKTPPHNHPWWFLSFVLWGGYREYLETHRNGNSSYWYKDRRWLSLHYMAKTTYHKFKLFQPTWTIVLTGSRHSDEWGVWDGERHIHQRDYFADKRVRHSNA